MKTRVKTIRLLVRESLKKLLNEATCPACGSKGAYQGLNTLECDNPNCEYFTETQSASAKQKPTSPATGGATKVRENPFTQKGKTFDDNVKMLHSWPGAEKGLELYYDTSARRHVFDAEGIKGFDDLLGTIHLEPDDIFDGAPSFKHGVHKDSITWDVKKKEWRWQERMQNEYGAP